MSTSRYWKRAAHYLLCALSDLNADSKRPERSGVTAKKLNEFLFKEYQLPERYKRHVSTALERGVTFGSIGQKSGKYFLVDVKDRIVQNRHRHRGRTRKRHHGHESRKRRRRRRRSIRS